MEEKGRGVEGVEMMQDCCRTWSCALSKSRKYWKNLSEVVTFVGLIFIAPAAILKRVHLTCGVKFWKHEAHLNTVVEIQPTDYVDLGHYDSREGVNMGFNAKCILNVNLARFPDS